MKHLKFRGRTGNDYNVGFGAVVLAGVSFPGSDDVQVGSPRIRT